MAAIPPILGDRPLAHAADDLLGFERTAESLAEQLQATPDGGLLVGVRGRRRGQGRTSFLNLLHGSLTARGVGVLRLRGAEGLALVIERLDLRPGLPLPTVILDDAEPELAASMAGLPRSSPAVVVAWTTRADADVARVASLTPLLVDLPPWNVAASGRLADRLAHGRGAEVGDLELWRAVLDGAGTPRRAKRIVNAALAAANSLGLPRRDVLEALALHLAGRAPAEAGRLATLVEDVGFFCGGIDVDEDFPQSTVPAERDPTEPLDVGGAHGAEPSRDIPPRGDDAGQDHDDAPAEQRTDKSPRRPAGIARGRTVDESSTADLARALTDASPETCRAAAAALGRLGGLEAARPLVLALEDPHAAVRMAAETALVAVLEDLPEGAFAELLADPDVQVRRSAVRAAQRLGMREVESLLSLLDDDEVAADAAVALGALEEVAALPALARAACSFDSAIRAAALDAVARVARGTASTGLAGLLAHDDACVRGHAVSALATCPGAVDALVPYLTDERAFVRSAAAEALGRCGDPRALRPLLEAHDHGDAAVRRVAATSLVRLGWSG